MQLAELVSRLEVIRKMFGTLFKLAVGTNVIECDAMRIVRERLAGPTGHRTVVERNCDNQKTVEEVEVRSQDCSTTQCWRDEKIIKEFNWYQKKDCQ